MPITLPPSSLLRDSEAATTAYFWSGVSAKPVAPKFLPSM
jgi:hypothetical protein